MDMSSRTFFLILEICKKGLDLGLQDNLSERRISGVEWGEVERATTVVG